MEVKIRKAEIGDLTKIQELNLLLFKKEIHEYDDTLDENWTFSDMGTKYFTNRITDENYCVFVAETDGQMVGYLAGGLSQIHAYRKINKAAELENMFVSDECRGQGIGTELVKKFKDWCKEKDIQKISVIASFKNRAGIGFYKKQGFQDYDVILEMDLL